MQQYVPIHQQNQFLYLCHHVVRLGLLHWTSFRQDLYGTQFLQYHFLVSSLITPRPPTIMQYAASDEHPRQFLAIPEESLQMVVSQVTDQNLRHTLQFGIGLHHAGLNDKDRSLVEELFSNNKIQAIVSRNTISYSENYSTSI